MQRFRFIRDVELGVKNLMLHSLRSLLTMLGVVFGVGSVVAMLSVGEGASVAAMKQIQKLGSTNIIVTSNKPQEDDQISNNSNRSYMSIYGLLYDDEDRIHDSMPAVIRTVAAKIVRKEARVGELAMDLRVVGTTPDWFTLVDRPIVAGRALSWKDIEESAGVCVLAESAARTLLAGNYIVGQPVRIGGDYFTVVGIVRTDDSPVPASRPPTRPSTPTSPSTSPASVSATSSPATPPDPSSVSVSSCTR